MGEALKTPGTVFVRLAKWTILGRASMSPIQICYVMSQIEVMIGGPGMWMLHRPKCAAAPAALGIYSRVGTLIGVDRSEQFCDWPKILMHKASPA